MKRTRTWLLTTSGVVIQRCDLQGFVWNLKFNILWIKLTCLTFLSYSLSLHRAWGRFEVFSVTQRRWWCPTRNNNKAGRLRIEPSTTKAKIFPWNRRSLFTISRGVNNSLPSPSFAGSQISSQRPETRSSVPAQICLSRCDIMRVPNGLDTRFENRILVTASARQKQHSVGVGRNYCLHANQHSLIVLWMNQFSAF